MKTTLALLVLLITPKLSSAKECYAIRDDDQRNLCEGTCYAIRNDDQRNLCSHSCYAIRNDDLRHSCE